MATCVVCQVPATVWCSNDKAFLCTECDVKIHSTNQLAARHSRVRVCGLCAAQPGAVYCHNDATDLCEGCDKEIHTCSSVAANHTVVPTQQLPACEVQSATPQVVVPASCESASGPCDVDFSSAFFNDCQEDEKALSPTGSEAVVPVMSTSMDNDFAAALAVPSFKDLKDFDHDFKVLDGDMAWLDLGFDFSDILSSDPPQDDAGLVPTFNGVDVEEPAIVPAAAPAPAASESGRKRSAPAAPAAERPAKVVAVAAGPAAYAAIQHMAYPGTAIYMAPAPAYIGSASHAAALAAGANLTREQRVARYREKRKNRKFEKTIRYASRKAYAEIRPRIKGRFARKDEIEAWKAAHGDDAVVPEILD